MNEKVTYIALIHQEGDSAYGVSFPDFPGCITAGDTLDEAMTNAHDVLPFHIEGMLEDDDDIPNPSTLQAIMADPDNLGALAVLVSIEMPTGKAVRVNVTFEERLLKQIDKYADEHSMTRSAFLAEASRRMMAGRVTVRREVPAAAPPPPVGPLSEFAREFQLSEVQGRPAWPVTALGHLNYLNREGAYQALLTNLRGYPEASTERLDETASAPVIKRKKATKSGAIVREWTTNMRLDQEPRPTIGDEPASQRGAT